MSTKAKSTGKSTSKSAKKPAAAAPPAGPDLGILAQIPDQDLEEIMASIKAGARNPAEALGFGPEALNAVEQMALGYYRSKLYDRAAVLYGFLLRMNPERGSAWRGLGACCQSLKNYPLAVHCYQLAVQCDPHDVVARVFWGECLCQVGEKENGVALLKDVVAQGTQDPAYAPYLTRARAVIGAGGGIPPKLVLMREGQKLVAEASAELQGPAFDPSREVQADDLSKNAALRPLLDELGQALKEGRLTYAEIGGFTKNELDGAYACACKYAEIGQVLQAVQIAGYLMFLDPYGARYYQLVGICLQRMKQYENADHYYKMALVLEKDNPMTLVYRGESKIMAGKADEGLDIVRQGIAAAKGKAEFKDMADRGQVLLRQFGAGA